MHARRIHRRLDGELALDELFVQPARRPVVEDGREQAQRGAVGLRIRRNVVGLDENFLPAGAPQGHFPFAVLRRLGRIQIGQDASRLGQHTEHTLNVGQRLGLIELARDDQSRIIGLIVRVVEILQALDRYVLDIRPRADGRMAVVVPDVGRLEHPLMQYGGRAVLTPLELVAHHGHLAVQVLLGNVGVQHPVGFQPQGPLDVGLRRRKGLEIIRPVFRRGGVGFGTVAGQLIRNLRMPRRALEIHVLQQVRHARLAVAFEARAHFVSHIYCRGRARVVREQQHLQSIGQAVLGHAFDGEHFLGCGRGGRPGLGGGGLGDCCLGDCGLGGGRWLCGGRLRSRGGLRGGDCAQGYQGQQEQEPTSRTTHSASDKRMELTIEPTSRSRLASTRVAILRNLTLGFS